MLSYEIDYILFLAPLAPAAFAAIRCYFGALGAGRVSGHYSIVRKCVILI